MVDELLVSVIVPIYNVEKYVKKCIESILNQTYTELEVILVDDGSTDSCGQICDMYAQKDNRCRVIHKPNGGHVNARKTGVLSAKGEYSICVDADDWIETDAIEKLVSIVSNNPVDMVTFSYKKEYSEFTEEKHELLPEGYYDIDEYIEKLGKLVDNSVFFCSGIIITIWSKLVRTELLRSEQLKIDERINVGEDIALVYDLLNHINSIYVYDSCLYHYMVRKNSVMHGSKLNYERYEALANQLSATWKDANNRMPEEMLTYVLYQYLLISGEYDHFINKNKIIFYPQISKNQRIIIYGKGVAANALRKAIEVSGFCQIVDQVDKLDCSRLKEVDETMYDYIVLAITDCNIVNKSVAILEELNVNKNKICTINKQLLIRDLLY